MGVIESDGSELAHSQQNTQGGYVMLNDDDDSYAFDIAGTLLPDTSQTNIPTEHDLVPLKLHAEDNPAFGGNYTLLTTSSNIKIWKEPTKITPVDSGTTFDASQNTTVYVEGIGESSAAAAEQINLRWSLPGLTPMNLDTANYTVYKLEGALNVPGYSSYKYTVDVPGGFTKSNSTWSDPANGTITSESVDASSAQVLWGSGPFIGRVFFSPAPGFVGERDVNVVEVTPTLGTVTTPGGAAASVHVDPNASLVVVTPPGDERFQTSVTVQGTGPDGKRGLQFIQIGYVQNVTVLSKFGDYPGGTETASLEGHSYVDPANGSTLPWTDSSSVDAYWGPTDNGTHDFDNSDGPRLGVPTTLEGAPAALLTTAGIEESFTRYLAVRTTDTSNNANQIYTVRLKASWSVDYSGSVDANGDYNPSAANALTGPMNNQFTLVEDGTAVPITTGQTANDATSNETWAKS